MHDIAVLSNFWVSLPTAYVLVICFVNLIIAINDAMPIMITTLIEIRIDLFVKTNLCTLFCKSIMVADCSATRPVK